VLGMRGATVYLSAHAVRHGLEGVLRWSFVHPYMVGARGLEAEITSEPATEMRSRPAAGSSGWVGPR
jgi:hypothetical protein